MIERPAYPVENEIVTDIIHAIKSKKGIISKLFARLQVSYRMIESIQIDNNQSKYKEHVILFSLFDEKLLQVLILFISIEKFINHFFRLVILDASRDEFKVGIFKEGGDVLLVATDFLDLQSELVLQVEDRGIGIPGM